MSHPSDVSERFTYRHERSPFGVNLVRVTCEDPVTGLSHAHTYHDSLDAEDLFRRYTAFVLNHRIHRAPPLEAQNQNVKPFLDEVEAVAKRYGLLVRVEIPSLSSQETFLVGGNSQSHTVPDQLRDAAAREHEE